LSCVPACSAASSIFSPASFSFSLALSTVALMVAESKAVVSSFSIVVVVMLPSGFSVVSTFVSDCLQLININENTAAVKKYFFIIR